MTLLIIYLGISVSNVPVAILMTAHMSEAQVSKKRKGKYEACPESKYTSRVSR